MRYYDISNLSFGQIHIFLSVMESGSFTEAAKKLSFTQSMISKTIASMERDLDLILFIRKKQQIIPTPAARALYEEWKKLHSKAERSIEKAHRIQIGMQSELTVVEADTGITGSGMVSTALRFQREYPEVQLCLENHAIGQIAELARQQAVDVLITAAFDEEELRNCGYTCRQLFKTRLAIFVHKSHPLAERTGVNFGELKSEKFIVLSPAAHPNYIPLLHGLGDQYGFTPQISLLVPNAQSFVINLLTRPDVVMADTNTAIIHDDIRMIPLTDLGEDYYNGAIIAWRDEMPEARNFARMAMEIYSE